VNPIIVTTTDIVPGKEIVEILGVVHGKSEKWTTESRAKDSAVKKMVEKAEKLGADAIVGVKITAGGLGRSVAVMGTAVKLK